MDFNYKFRTDPEKLKGTVVPLFPGDPATITVRRLNNEEYIATLTAYAEEYRREKKVITIPDKDWQELQCIALAKHVLVGWSGFTDKGTPVPYTEVAAAAFMKESPDFRTRVVNEAADLDNFVFEMETTIAKNS